MDKLYEFRDGKVKEHLGGVSEFLERRRIESLNELERQGTMGADVQKEEETVQKKEEAKQEYQAKKFISKEERKIRTRIANVEKEIEAIEEKMKKIESVLAMPGEGDDVMELTRTYLECKRSLDAKMLDWETLSESIES